MSSYEQTRLADIAGSTINPATEEGQINLLTELELKANITDIQPVNDAAIQALITLLTDLIEARSEIPSILDALNVQIGPTDPFFDNPVTISHTHHQIHQGNTFKALEMVALGTSTLKYAFVTTTDRPHLIISCDVFDGSARVDLYKDATFTGGTTIPIFNKNFNSATTPLSTITSGVTSTDGTLVESFYVGTGKDSAGASRVDSEWILEPSSIYRIDFVGLVSADVINAFSWYNHQ